MSSDLSKVVLVDGSSYLFRAYHALPPLTNSKGWPTWAIYGVANMLKKLIKDENPAYIAVVFDSKGKTFRHDLYPLYKANRTLMPDNLAAQIEPLYELITAMGLPLIYQEGVEADDLIASVARQCVVLGKSVLISTSDKDFAQLVDDNIHLVNTMTGLHLDAAGVKEKFGVPPNRILDYLALMGDAVDNIPGVPKVGPKTAVKWIEEFGGIEDIIANKDKITGKVGEYLAANIEQLRLSYVLVTIKQDVGQYYALEQLSLRPPNMENLIALVTALEFKNWAKELNNIHVAIDAPIQQLSENTSKVDFVIINDENTFLTLVDKLQRANKFIIDLETTSLDYIAAKIVGIAFALLDEECGYYLPLAHQDNSMEQLELRYVLDKLKPILENGAIVKIGHNIKYDLNVLRNYYLTLNNIEDTMLMSYVLNSVGSRHNMDDLAKKHLNYDTITYEDVAGKGVKQKNFSEVAILIAAEYSAEDAIITRRLYQLFSEKLAEEVELKDLYFTLELPMIKVLSDMECTGVFIDTELLAVQSKELEIKLQVLENEVHILAGEEFNLGSPKQLQHILFEKLQLPILQKTPTGQPSTGEEVLQELAENFAMPKLILEYRTLSKLKSTYTDALPQQVSEITGRIHTSYHQAVTATGRLSSSDPNLQNIPIRSAEGRRIRQAFIAAQGCKIIAADYSQIELRILAHLSQDLNLITAFNRGLDIHSATAADIFGIDVSLVDKEQRRKAKAINFGLIYGMSSFGLAKQLGVDKAIAAEYMDLYFAKYPQVKVFMDRTREFAQKNGYVRTVLGRRLYLPDINSKNGMLQKYAQRAAINAPMQGGNADLIKKAMIALKEWIDVINDNAKIKLLMQVHDELVFEVQNEYIAEYIVIIKNLMQDTVKLSVPLVVDIGVGNNWDEAH